MLAAEGGDNTGDAVAIAVKGLFHLFFDLLKGLAGQKGKGPSGDIAAKAVKDKLRTAWATDKSACSADNHRVADRFCLSGALFHTGKVGSLGRQHPLENLRE